MIQKMKKLNFLVYHREYDQFLHRLQELGVMHIQGGAVADNQSESVNADIAELRRVDDLLKRTEDLLATASPSPSEGTAPSGSSAETPVAEDLPSQFESLLDSAAALSLREKDLSAQIDQLTPWGDFDPAYVQEQMALAGCEMQFFTAPTKAFRKDIAPYYPVEAINELKGTTYFVAITRTTSPLESGAASAADEASNETSSIPATPVTLPCAALSALRTEHDQAAADYAATTSQLRTLADAHSADLSALRDQLAQRLSFDYVRTTTETAADDHLMVLRGWIPADKQADISAAFADSAAWYEIADPQPGDDVPVCLKNNRFFRLFEMITELYMLPKYNELDLTPFFAPFYILFFGLCLGDSGYGLFITLMVLAVKFLKKDMGQGMRAALNLLLTMGISAMLCGLLSGAFFGFNLYDLGVPLFDSIGSVAHLENSQLFNLSLILGFIQIIFGMILKAYNRTIQFGFAYSLSTIGWILIILSLAASMFLPDYAATSRWFTYAGLALAFCYNSPERYRKNPVTGLLINVGSGLWDAYNTATGMLGDMLSYVRLFALGLSGGILATVFDSLATGLAPDNVILGPIVVVLIFVIGHALNMFMNVLGAFVHPMRLTFVEFFKNAGYEGGGTGYTPFK